MIQAVVDSGVAELEVQHGEDRVRIKRSSRLEREVVLQPVTAPVQAPAAPAVVSTGAAYDQGLITVKAPIVGTFYEAPSLESAPFVRVGDAVKPGQVLCIIESMKLMNEIESEVAGSIVAILVENSSPIEYGEALFSVRPL